GRRAAGGRRPGPFFEHPRVVALAEMMNYPGVIFTDPAVMANWTWRAGSIAPWTGHAPGLFRPAAMRLRRRRHHLGPRVHPCRGGPGKTRTGDSHHGA
ncbi:hypothetical protein, partial [Desulfosarcina cetonica]|uniref:hypothetical protein n=1 Tax=Desulfosarcina cetonica TaxID=90730 RepID=UPI001C455A33